MSKQDHICLLLTGSTGFLGMALTRRLLGDLQYSLVVTSRFDVSGWPLDVVPVSMGSLEETNKDWMKVLTGIEVIIHTAARVHVMNDSVFSPLDEFRRVNVEGTLNLARQAAASDVKRFIFISSVKVNGESTSPSRPFTEQDIPLPVDPYGISKLEAEEGLRSLAKETGMEVVIIRPPLVYGPGVKANFKRMMQWVDSGIPLPLGAIRNKRSLVALDNLIDFIITCIEHPDAADQTFLVGDGEDLSTTALLHRVGRALDKPAHLIPVPPKILNFGLSLIGKQAISKRLCESLQVDISKAREVLNWEPPVSIDTALRMTAEYYSKNKRK
ncbi:SDR family oxidoreductase [Motiliproteus sp. MSK22-1]|uniref:UDP-glucose 4-epimerase family protein n=1 Tax=Motiliproteus sp. MSK22-1 TaxID=1897630 RepID=UPI0009780855|nr:SDR family oxidoreductase [Motiliproteus sp. MSK22-1]OMH30900.1 hypothetical protein BGP75_00770 [Motiliproteus sp. MSK22-1]